VEFEKSNAKFKRSIREVWGPVVNESRKFYKKVITHVNAHMQKAASIADKLTRLHI